MTRLKLVLAIASSAVALSACDRTTVADGNRVAQADAAADEQAIRSTNERWLQLIRAKDAAAIAQLYTEDGAVLPANEKAALGRESIEQWWNSSMQMPDYDLTFETDQLVISKAGDMALDRGTYRFAATPPGGAINDSGKYVVVWRKVDGEWKVAADIFNSDGPAAGG